jgi:hypothetical protein
MKRRFRRGVELTDTPPGEQVCVCADLEAHAGVLYLRQAGPNGLPLPERCLAPCGPEGLPWQFHQLRRHRSERRAAECRSGTASSPEAGRRTLSSQALPRHARPRRHSFHHGRRRCGWPVRTRAPSSAPPGWCAARGHLLRQPSGGGDRVGHARIAAANGCAAASGSWLLVSGLGGSILRGRRHGPQVVGRPRGLCFMAVDPPARICLQPGLRSRAVNVSSGVRAGVRRSRPAGFPRLSPPAARWPNGPASRRPARRASRAGRSRSA